MKAWIVSIVAMFFLAQPLSANSAKDVKATVTKRIGQVITLLRDTKIKRATRDQKILDIVNPIFDFKKMAKLSLGKTHWKSFSKAQRKEFSDLFVKRLQESYLEKLSLYTDEDVVVDDATQVKKNRIVVLTHLVSKDDKKEMIYKFYKSKKKGWMVYDVDVLGVSIVQTYRSQFTGVLKNESIEGLLAQLRKQGTMKAVDLSKK